MHIIVVSSVEPANHRSLVEKKNIFLENNLVFDTVINLFYFIHSIYFNLFIFLSIYLYYCIFAFI